MTIFTGEICVYCDRPIMVDEKDPKLARCRTCSAPYHTKCWFAANEKCTMYGCPGKASDIASPNIKELRVQFGPAPTSPRSSRRDGNDSQDQGPLNISWPNGMDQIPHVLASVRHAGRQTRRLLQHVVGSSSKQSVQILNAVATATRGSEKVIKELLKSQENSSKRLEIVAELLRAVQKSIEGLGGDQQAAAAGFDRLAAAVEASGVGEQVRGRRESRLAARAALRDGRPGAAVNMLTQALRRGYDESVANDLATSYVKAGKPNEAIEVLEKVLAQNASYTPCRITLASLRMRAGEPQVAEDLLRDAPQPNNPLLRAELAYARACTAYAVGRSEDAVDLLNQTLAEDPWHSAAAAALEDLRARRTGDAAPDAAALALSVADVSTRDVEEAADG